MLSYTGVTGSGVHRTLQKALRALVRNPALMHGESYICFYILRYINLRCLGLSLSPSVEN